MDMEATSEADYCVRYHEVWVLWERLSASISRLESRSHEIAEPRLSLIIWQNFYAISTSKWNQWL
jgi:hypothetical protein